MPSTDFVWKKRSIKKTATTTTISSFCILFGSVNFLNFWNDTYFIEQNMLFHPNILCFAYSSLWYNADVCIFFFVQFSFPFYKLPTINALNDYAILALCFTRFSFFVIFDFPVFFFCCFSSAFSTYFPSFILNQSVYFAFGYRIYVECTI